MSSLKVIRDFMEKMLVEGANTGRVLRNVTGSAVLGLAVMGCGEATDDQTKVSTQGLTETPVARICRTNSDCKPGEICIELMNHFECPPGAFCILPPTPPTGVCQPAPKTKCYTDKDCKEGEVCVGGTNTCPPGAYCILPPTPGTCEPKPEQCYTDEDCPAGQICIGANTCPPGAFCILPPSPGTCQDQDPGCPPGAYCILPPSPPR